MKPIKVKAGQKLKIKVPIKGAPPPEVAWAKGGVVLKPKPKRRPPTKEEEAEMVKLKGFTKSKSCHPSFTVSSSFLVFVPQAPDQ